MGLVKHGDKEQGRIIPEEGDDRKTASEKFSDSDREALRRENEEADGSE